MNDPTNHPAHGAAQDPAHEAGHGHEVRSEEDRISSGKVIAVGVASLVVFFFASLAAGSYLRARQKEHPVVPAPEIGKSKIAMVEQDMFDVAVRGARDRAQRLEKLASYGWIDRDARVVHMPIERAMDLVAKGVRPAQAPTGGEAAPPGAQP
jgi:hypothetical protein